MQRVDYDRIAHLYDEPLREHGADVHLATFLAERPDLEPDRIRILDLGCGTGRQLAANRAAFPDVWAAGLDLFGGMLAIARARCPDRGWVRGDASQLPFRSERFHYATNQFSYHHIPDKAGFVREVFRVLAPGGRFVMTNIDPWAMPDWIVYRFFPEARERDHRDFLPAQSFAALLRGAGFADVNIAGNHRHLHEPVAEFLAYARQRHRASQFMALSDDHYEAGVRRVEQAVAHAADPRTPVDSEFCVLTVHGDKA